jgi:hypothetical protein
VSVSHVKNEKLLKIDWENKGPDWKPIKIFDWSATENEFSNLIERKKQELWRNLSSSEIENLKKEFIESNFEKLSPNEEEAIKKILAYIDGKRESTAILNNMDAYVDNYLENWAEWNFRDYLIEKWIDPDATPTLSNKDNTENFATETSSNNYDYDQKGWILDFEHNWQKTKVTLNEQEKSLARQNKETLKNIIDFYKTLDSVWLTDIWPYREQIFKWIQDVKPMGEFKSYNYDYLSENEIKIFLNAILKSTWREEIHSQLYPNLNWFIGKFKNLNGTNAFWNVEELGLSQSNAFSLWKSRIEQDFLNKFVNEGNFGFNQMKFRLTLNKE